MKSSNKRTWSRELAAGLLLYLVLLTTFAAISSPGSAVGLVEILVFPFVTFAAGAFGLKVFMNKSGGGTVEHTQSTTITENTEYTVNPEEGSENK